MQLRRWRSRGSSTFAHGGLGQTVNPHTHVRDDAEGALGADKKLTQIGACSGCRRTPGLDHSTRGDNGEALNHVLEAPVSSRRLPRRPGGGKPAQSGEQEALREVPDRETVLTQKLLGPWPVVPPPNVAMPDSSSNPTS